MKSAKDKKERRTYYILQSTIKKLRELAYKMSSKTRAVSMGEVIDRAVGEYKE